MRGPLAFNWGENPPMPHPAQVKPSISLKHPSSGLPITQDMSRLQTLSNYLHGFQIQIAGVNFEIVTRHRQFYPNNEEELRIGLHVLKDESFALWMDPWDTPWDKRVRFPAPRGYNAQDIFSPGIWTRGAENYFSTHTHEGLGWLLAKECPDPSQTQNPLLNIETVQEDAYFSAEAKRQFGQHRRKIKMLRLIWRNLLIAALEDVSSRLEYASISALSLGPWHQYYYDILFSKRRAMDSDVPLYQRTFYAHLPHQMKSRLIFDAGDTIMVPRFYWVYNFGKLELPPEDIIVDETKGNDDLTRTVQREHPGVISVIVV